VSVESETPGASPRRTVRPPNVTGMRWLVLALVVVVGAFILDQAFGPGSGQASSPPATHTPPAPTTHPPTNSSPSPSPNFSATITIYNATGTPHLAAGEQNKLQNAGFTQVATANAAALAKTTIFYTRPAGQSTAEYIKGSFYPTALLKAATAGSQFASTDVAIVLGSDFTG
jgi:LytR cell envelope-related transcriptional attenuator